MMPARGGFPWTFVLGYVALAMGGFGMTAYYFARVEYAAPQDMGIVQGNTGLILLGLITLVIAQSIKRLEKRLEELENTNDGKEKRNIRAP